LHSKLTGPSNSTTVEVFVTSVVVWPLPLSDALSRTTDGTISVAILPESLVLLLTMGSVLMGFDSIVRVLEVVVGVAVVVVVVVLELGVSVVVLVLVSFTEGGTIPVRWTMVPERNPYWVWSV